MARRKQGSRKRADALTYEQFIGLWLGPRSAAGLQAFPDDNAAQDSYVAHRDELFRRFGGEIVKTWCFRKFEPGQQRREPLDVGDELRRHEAEWRERDRLAALESEAQGERPETEVLDYNDVAQLRGSKVG